MNREYGVARYRSTRVDDNSDGFSAMELHRSYQGTKSRIARVVFWDACGQFSVETFGTEVPVEILEELIAEAKTSIKTR